MKKKLLSLYLVITSSFLYSQPNVAWTKTYSMPGYIYYIADAVQDNAKNTLVLANKVNTDNNDVDPVLISYDDNGNLILNWIHSDSLSIESAIQVVTDSLNDIYVLTATGNVIVDTVRITKIDGATGQEIYSKAMACSPNGGIIAINQECLYLGISAPNSLLNKYDLQGNQYWSVPISTMDRFFQFQFYQNEIFLIGDTITDSFNWVHAIQKIDSSGTKIWQTISSVPNPYFMDSEIDLISTVSISGSNTNSDGFLTIVDSVGITWDTLIGNSQLTLSKSRHSLNNSGELFWAHINTTTAGRFCEVTKKGITGSTSFASIDSCNTGGTNFPEVFGVDVNCMPDGSLMVANTRRESSILSDYEISSFDSNGNLNWNLIYTHGQNTIENVFMLTGDSMAAYVVGEKKDSVNGSKQINVLKLDLVSGINESQPTKNELQIFPNPVVVNEVNFNSYIVQSNIYIVDIYGRVLKRIENFSGDKISIDKSFKNGLYNIMIENENYRVSKKLIVQRSGK